MNLYKAIMKNYFTLLLITASTTFCFSQAPLWAKDQLMPTKDLAEKIWSDAVGGKDMTALKIKCRRLQDQIFDHRKKNPPVFDFLFRWFRDGSETLMNKGAETLVSEVEASRATPNFMKRANL